MRKLILLITLLSALATSQAQSATPTCTATFLATLAGGPALKPTKLTIRQNGVIVLEAKTSSATIKTLQCGKTYVATVSTDVTPQQTVTRTRTFTLLISSRVFVAMDPK